MRIESLSLNDFRSHEHTKFNFDRLNFVIGANRSGKSSIAMAVQFLLCGTCGVTDEGGRGSEDLIRIGADQAEVSADIITGESAAWSVRRAKGSRGQELQLQAGGMLPLVEAQKKLTQRIGIPLEVLRAVLDSDRFIDLEPAAQKKLLSSVLADSGIAVPADLQKVVGAGQLTITELDALYKAAYAQRTNVNRDLKQLSNLPAPATLEAPKVEEVKARIASINADRDTAVNNRRRLLADYEAGNGRREEINSDIEAFDALILPLETEKQLKVTADKVEGLTKSASMGAHVRQLIQDRSAESAKLGMKAACPMCTRSLTKQEMSDLVKIIDAHAANLKEQLKRIEADERELLEALATRERIHTSIKAQGEKENLQAELANLPEIAEAPDTSEIDGQIAALDARIAKGQDVLVSTSALREQIRQYNESMGKRARLDDELAIVEKVLAFAGPDGARKEATGGKLPAFREAMNTALAHFGFVSGIEFEPFAFFVAGAEDAPRSLHQLSESEKFRFSIAFQIALAQVTGIGLVVIDHADILDRESRRQLTAMLLSSGIEQAIVCSTSTDAPPASIPEGVKFFQLEQRDGITGLATLTTASAA